MGETRRCNVCGEYWTDTGALECPFCGSDDTYIEDEGGWYDDLMTALDEEEERMDREDL